MKKYAALLVILSLVTASIACEVGGDDQPSIDLELKRGHTVGDLVWEDLNANGVQDTGEPGIPDVSVFLWDVDQNAVVSSTRTDAQGKYAFTVLARKAHQL